MDNIQSILDGVIAKRNEANNSKRTGGAITPSQLGKCTRAIMCKDKKLPELPFTANQLRTFACGFIFEGFVLDILEETKTLVKRQMEVEYRGIKGTLDSVISLNGENVLFDVKSVKTDKFLYLDKGEIDLTYALQLTFYHKALQGKMELSKTARILYTEKDNLLIKEVPVVCENYYEQLDKRIDELLALKAQKDLPAEVPPEPWMCWTFSKRYKTCKIWCQHIKNCPKILAEYKAKCKAEGIAEDERIK